MWVNLVYIGVYTNLFILLSIRGFLAAEKMYAIKRSVGTKVFLIKKFIEHFSNFNYPPNYIAPKYNKKFF